MIQGKVKWDESNINEVKEELKNNLEELFTCVMGDRKFSDLKVSICTDWNALESVRGHAFDKYLNSQEDKYYSGFKFKTISYCRRILFDDLDLTGLNNEQKQNIQNLSRDGYLPLKVEDE